MAALELLATPLVLFLASLAFALLLYLWGGVLAPRRRPGGAKEEMYTGGERPPKQPVRPSYQFYHVALFFTLLHLAAIVLATSTGGVAWVALAYLGTIAVALAALTWR